MTVVEEVSSTSGEFQLFTGHQFATEYVHLELRVIHEMNQFCLYILMDSAERLTHYFLIIESFSS